MMETNLEELVVALSRPQLSTDIIYQLTSLIEQQSGMSLSSFVSQSFQSLLTLEQWAWQLLSQDYLQWINQPYYIELFHTLASFNKNLIFNDNDIDADAKAMLLFPVTIDQINNIFKQIENSNDDNDPLIIIASLWFDNHSYFVHENPNGNILFITDHINQYIAQKYLMSEQFKFYLTQLRHSHIPQSLFTAKMLFYIKTCSFSLFSYIGARFYRFPFTPDEILHYIGDDYLQIIHIHSRTVASWNKQLLVCIAHLISFIAGCCWWDGQKRTQTNILFPIEQMVCDHVQDLIDIIAHRPFHKQIKAVRSNDETILIDAILTILLNIVQTQNINWFLRSSSTIQDVLVVVGKISVSDKLCLCAYGILGEFLTDEQLKDLKIVETIGGFFFNMLERAWHHTSKKDKHMPIEYLLRGFLNLSKHDFIQQSTADSNKIPLLIEICDQYPIVYDILWALSFNEDVQKQLHSNASFMSRLYHLTKACDNEQMRKITHGLLWNLKSHHNDRPISEINHEKKFDIMISYSHKDKILCQQIYKELTKEGYRIWIDFDQMHGNVMDAMAQAIEQSHTVIICMSEEYRKSNYCRAEAHYAFQCECKIVPVLLQKHYKPDGWLLFLIGQLLYVDFIKHEFDRALKMLLKELSVSDIPEADVVPVPHKEDIDVAPVVLPLPVSKASPSPILPQNILEWTQTHVQNWLVEHNLIQMSRLLADCDGRSLIYLSKYIKHSELRDTLNSFREDSLRRLNQNLSFIELSRFQSLIDQQRPDQ